MILDSEAFIERVIKAAEKAGFSAYFSGVKYSANSEHIKNMSII